MDRFDRVKLLAGVLLVFAGLYAVLPLTFISKVIPLSVSYTLIILLTISNLVIFPRGFLDPRQ